MLVLLMRHGEAVDPSVAGSDGSRWLTQRGRDSVRSVAAALQQRRVRPDAVFTSPLVRAVQTAEILASVAGFEGEVRARAVLAGGTATQVTRLLDDVTGAEVVSLVGHMPLIAAVAAHLTGTPSKDFRTSMIAAVRRDDERGRLEWVLEPE